MARPAETSIKTVTHALELQVKLTTGQDFKFPPPEDPGVKNFLAAALVGQLAATKVVVESLPPNSPKPLTLKTITDPFAAAIELPEAGEQQNPTFPFPNMPPTSEESLKEYGFDLEGIERAFRTVALAAIEIHLFVLKNIMIPSFSDIKGLLIKFATEQEIPEDTAEILADTLAKAIKGLLTDKIPL